MSHSEPQTIGERFAANLRYCRRQAGHNQQELADQAGIDRPRLAALESNGDLPHLDEILDLALGTGFQPELLLRGMSWQPGLEWQVPDRDREDPVRPFHESFKVVYIPGHFRVGIGLETEREKKARIRKRAETMRPLLDRLADGGD